MTTWLGGLYNKAIFVWIFIYRNETFILDILGPTRKILVAGSVPTENLPKKSHEIEKPERRPLIRIPLEETSTSSTSALSVLGIAEGDALETLDVDSLAPWISEKMGNSDTKFKLWDGVHSIGVYCVCLQLATSSET